MKFDVLTLFPEIIENYCSASVIGRAAKQDVISVNTVNPRDFTESKHKKVDDIPYGGGAGMVLACQPFYDAYGSIEKLQNSVSIILTPQGKPFNQKIAEEFSKKDQLIMFCGHYEGYDERIREIPNLIEISIGDFVLTGGELGALCIIDAVTRLIPGGIGKEESAEYDSFSEDLLEYPHYTRPFEFRGKTVPEVLISGNHKEIAKWRKIQAILKTKEKRPDLFEKFIQRKHTKEEIKILKELNLWT
jgi:tRNA (guanine37-N1)-methyltransferase